MKQKEAFTYRSSFLPLAGMILLFCVLFSCSNKKSQKRVTAYFAVDSLVEAQIKFLSSVNTTVSKTVSFNNETRQVKLSPSDTTFWLKELEVFSQINEINKPDNRGEYQVEDGLLDTQSNLKVKLFTANSLQKISWLKLYYHKTLSDLKKLEAQLSEENGLYGTRPLYKSSRILTMEFQTYNNKTVLTSYSVIGGQKIFSADTTQYSVKGEISIH